jgi:NAD+ kinase
MIAIGGDGAMLRAGRLCGLLGVPVFGLNAGHLGFLTEANLDQWEQSLDLLMTDRFWIEERLMIRCEVWRDDTRLHLAHALNDIVIGRGASGKLVLLDLYIDGEWTTTYNADGLIIATPTGSTAYALAVDGPILPPELKNILVVPVAPHLSLDRPLVLSQGATVEVVVAPGRAAPCTLIADGDTLEELLDGDEISIHSSDFTSRFVRVREHNYFYRSLLDRMEPRLPAEPRPRIRRVQKQGEDR